jgi:hypothetical protein
MNPIDPSIARDVLRAAIDKTTDHYVSVRPGVLLVLCEAKPGDPVADGLASVCREAFEDGTPEQLQRRLVMAPRDQLEHVLAPGQLG